MKFTTKACLVLASCTLASTGLAIAPAQAQELNVWNYTIDSFNDGSELGVTGANSAFEFYGLALKATADTVFVAINSNLALAGHEYLPVDDDHIGYGDLFLNFTGSSKYKDAEGSENLFGIRFAANSDSGVEVGVYSGVTSMDKTEVNSGFKSLKHHKDVIGTSDFGDLDWAGTGNGYTNYFGATNQNRKFATSIKSGTKIGDVTLLDASQLSGLNFGQFGAVGNHTFGFSFDRNLLPEDGGAFIAHLVAECLNDGLAMVGQLPSIPQIEVPDPVEEAPEPAMLTGFVLLGGMGLLKRRAQQKAEMA